MRAKRIHEAPQKTYALIFDTGDEVIETLRRFAREERLSAAQFTGLGALSDVVLGYFQWDKKDYKRIAIKEQVEVLALVGDIAITEEDEPALHAHIVLGKSDGTAHGGHLLEAHVRPTLEVVLTESPAFLHRRKDPETGLLLIRIDHEADR